MTTATVILIYLDLIYIRFVVRFFTTLGSFYDLRSLIVYAFIALYGSLLGYYYNSTPTPFLAHATGSLELFYTHTHACHAIPPPPPPRLPGRTDVGYWRFLSVRLHGSIAGRGVVRDRPSVPRQCGDGGGQCDRVPHLPCLAVWCAWVPQPLSPPSFLPSQLPLHVLMSLMCIVPVQVGWVGTGDLLQPFSLAFFLLSCTLHSGSAPYRLQWLPELHTLYNLL